MKTNCRPTSRQWQSRTRNCITLGSDTSQGGLFWEQVCDGIYGDAPQLIDYEKAIQEMELKGGSLVKGLAYCYVNADPKNRERLKTAFAEYFEHYGKVEK